MTLFANNELSKKDNDNQVFNINKKNQKHLKIKYCRYLRENQKDSSDNRAIKEHEYMFDFIYDKTNPQSWHATFKPFVRDKDSSETYLETNNLITYTTIEILSPKDKLVYLTSNLAPVPYSPFFEDHSLMGYLLKNIFNPDGTTNLTKLEKLHTHAQTCFYNTKENNILYILFDSLATKFDLEHPENSNKLILEVIQTIDKIQKTDLKLTKDNEENFLTNGVIDQGKIKTNFNFQQIEENDVPEDFYTNLHNILKEYLDKRIHNYVVANYWSMVAKKQCDDALYYAHFFNYAWLALAIVNVILMGATIGLLVVTSSPNFLLSFGIFAAGAFFFGYKAQKASSDGTILRSLEQSAAESLENASLSIIKDMQELSKQHINTACVCFNQFINKPDSTTQSNQTPDGIVKPAF